MIDLGQGSVHETLTTPVGPTEMSKFKNILAKEGRFEQHRGAWRVVQFLSTCKTKAVAYLASLNSYKSAFASKISSCKSTSTAAVSAGIMPLPVTRTFSMEHSEGFNVSSSSGLRQRFPKGGGVHVSNTVLSDGDGDKSVDQIADKLRVSDKKSSEILMNSYQQCGILNALFHPRSGRPFVSFNGSSFVLICAILGMLLLVIFFMLNSC